VIAENMRERISKNDKNLVSFAEIHMLNQARQSGIPVLLGIRFDANSSYLRGATGAPPLIREALHSDSSNSSTETGIELDPESLQDTGDLGDVTTGTEGATGGG
jgi:arginase family enzyme